MSRKQRNTGPLTKSELNLAESYFYCNAQRSACADEVAVLLDQKTAGSSSLKIPKGRSIYYLGSFLDHDEVLRLRGRTGVCQFIDQEAVNPIILPRSHHVTSLIVSHYH